MKSVVLRGKRNLQVMSTEVPKSKNGSVVVDIKKTGICGSDIHFWDSGMPEGLVLGHEICGVVVDPGKRKDLKKGDRVTALPISPCGKCDSCLTGNPQCCPATWSDALGLSLTTPGGYSESCAIRPDMVVKVPDNITDAEVAMVEPTAVGLHAVNLADIKIGSKVLVIGAGIIGQICALLAKLNGASFVAVSETNEKRGRKAVSLKCADEFFDAKDPNFMQNVMANCPNGYDVVFDCSGCSAAVTTALITAKPQGTVVMVGVNLESITIPSMALVMHELKVLGAAAYTYDEFVECVNLMSSRKIDMLKFVDDIVSLDGVQDAFERLTSGDDNAIKILIDPKK